MPARRASAGACRPRTTAARAIARACTASLSTLGSVDAASRLRDASPSARGKDPVRSRTCARRRWISTLAGLVASERGPPLIRVERGVGETRSLPDVAKGEQQTAALVVVTCVTRRAASTARSYWIAASAAA